MPLTETIAIASWADRVKGRTAKPIARFPADKKPDNKQVIKEVYKENIKADVKQEINGQVSTADGKCISDKFEGTFHLKERYTFGNHC